MAFQFTDDNFKAEALEAELPVLVDFYADWCGPCKMMAPVVEAQANILRVKSVLLYWIRVQKAPLGHNRHKYVCLQINLQLTYLCSVGAAYGYVCSR